MPFEKGKSGNPDGKPKGSKNKVDNSMKEILKIAFTPTIEKITDILATLDPEKQLEMLSKFLPFFAPKLQTVNVTDEDLDPRLPPVINIKRRSETDDEQPE